MAKRRTINSTKQMIGLLDLPNELILEIANHTESQTQLSRMSRTNKRLHELLTSELLRRNVRDDGSSAALWAFRNNHIEMLSRLHSYGANLYDPKDMPFRWSSLLSEAARAGNIVMVEVLIQLGVDPTLDCGKYHGPFVSALAGEQDEIAKLLVSFLPSLESPVFEDGRTVLHVAAGWHRGEVVKYLLELGADANYRTPRTIQSTFDELLGEDGVEFRGCGYGEDAGEEIRDAAFEMLTILLENGAEPDDEAYAKGATSSVARVRLLFCNREVNVGKRRAIKAELKTHRQTDIDSAEVDQDEQWQELCWRPAENNRKGKQQDAFPPLSDSPTPSAIAPRQSWNPLYEPLDKRFPALTGQAPRATNARNPPLKNPSITATNESSQNDSHPSKGKKYKSSNRKWQKLQF